MTSQSSWRINPTLCFFFNMILLCVCTCVNVHVCVWGGVCVCLFFTQELLLMTMCTILYDYEYKSHKNNALFGEMCNNLCLRIYWVGHIASHTRNSILYTYSIKCLVLQFTIKSSILNIRYLFHDWKNISRTSKELLLLVCGIIQEKVLWRQIEMWHHAQITHITVPDVIK